MTTIVIRRCAIVLFRAIIYVCMCAGARVLYVSRVIRKYS